MLDASPELPEFAVEALLPSLPLELELELALPVLSV
jgi:hypothetical protein